MCQTEVKARALADTALLDEVVAFKRKFYRCNWAKYELATAKAISLMPPEHALKALEADYRHMGNMIFGDKPTFDELMNAIAGLETEIHSL